jgi:hypothetical protein
MYLASILKEAGDLELAEEHAGDAERALTGLDLPLRPYALGVLADVRLARGDAAGALALARTAFALLETAGGVEEGESLIRLVHARALHAAGDVAAAREAIAEALRSLGKRADRIRDPELRRSFLESVPENARTRELARAWLDDPG